MKARLRKFLSQLSETFWLVPGAMVLGGIALAIVLVDLDRGGHLPAWLTTKNWFYNGGGTGARTLLGAIASSTIGVAGTVFSITIAALSLAAGQMGPRLLRSFTSDRGVQVTLGAFLGTFSYALMVLRSVRTQGEGPFTPHLALSFGILLAFACVATLVYFVAHMANRINVDTVIELVSADVRVAIESAAVETEQVEPPPETFWSTATIITDKRRGYLEQIDEEGLADWAAEHGTAVRLLVRRGDYVFNGAPIAVMTVPVEDAEQAIVRATALGTTRGCAGDAEHAVRQLVEVAVRALSPGINDPQTAMSAINQLGTALCDLAGARLPSGVNVRDGAVVLVVPNIRYSSLTKVMFHTIRQNAAGCTDVIIRMLEVLTRVAACETDRDRRGVLMHHADLTWADAQRDIKNPADLADVAHRYALLRRTVDHGVLAALSDTDIARA